MLIQKRVAVIGAGPAGLSAAKRLTELGAEVTVFEAGSSVGGMAKSFELWGQVVDLGPHRFFSSDPRVNQFWLDATNNNYVMVDRSTRILYDGRFFDYPLKAANALRQLGVIESLLSVLSYLREKLFFWRAKGETFDDWVTSRFGRRLYRTFFETYSRKLWGIEPHLLDADFAAQRIKKFSLWEAIRSAIGLGTRTNHKTLVDEFAYPREGAGSPYENIARDLTDSGSELLLENPVEEIETLQEGGFRLTSSSGFQVESDHIVSTMPLTHLVKKLRAPARVIAVAEELKFRSTILAYLEVVGPNPFEDQWVYVHSQELQTGRVTNFSNWSGKVSSTKDRHVICMEYWAYFSDSIWTWEDQKVIELAREELKMSGLLGEENHILRGEVRKVPNCYPVYEQGYQARLEVLQDFVSGYPEVHPIGRYGAFKYNNQDHSILMGLLAAENIAGGASHDLWGINTDYEYQESSRISETGLVHY